MALHCFKNEVLGGVLLDSGPAPLHAIQHDDDTCFLEEQVVATDCRDDDVPTRW